MFLMLVFMCRDPGDTTSKVSCCVETSYCFKRAGTQINLDIQSCQLAGMFSGPRLLILPFVFKLQEVVVETSSTKWQPYKILTDVDGIYLNRCVRTFPICRLWFLFRYRDGYQYKSGCCLPLATTLATFATALTVCTEELYQAASLLHFSNTSP